jgi:histone H4
MSVRRYKPVRRDNIQGLKNPEFKRLAARAGIATMSTLVYADLRDVTKAFLDQVVGDATIFMEHARRRTLTIQDVLLSLEKNGYKMLWTGGAALKKCPASSKNTSQCTQFGKAPFHRLLKEIASDFITNVRIGPEAAAALHVATEDYLVRVFRNARAQAVQAQRQRVVPKNIRRV